MLTVPKTLTVLTFDWLVYKLEFDLTRRIGEAVLASTDLQMVIVTPIHDNDKFWEICGC